MTAGEEYANLLKVVRDYFEITQERAAVLVQIMTRANQERIP